MVDNAVSAPARPQMTRVTSLGEADCTWFAVKRLRGSVERKTMAAWQPPRYTPSPSSWKAQHDLDRLRDYTRFKLDFDIAAERFRQQQKQRDFDNQLRWRTQEHFNSINRSAGPLVGVGAATIGLVGGGVIGLAKLIKLLGSKQPNSQSKHRQRHFSVEDFNNQVEFTHQLGMINDQNYTTLIDAANEGNLTDEATEYMDSHVTGICKELGTETRDLMRKARAHSINGVELVKYLRELARRQKEEKVNKRRETLRKRDDVIQKNLPTLLQRIWGPTSLDQYKKWKQARQLYSKIYDQMTD